ncbi:MAG: 2-succinyl-5-enolpyruvyl-6-hydroxy-3-cyclohexene-1-carboxylic-acid synthase [Acidimicrobiia bacterium]|nr:2-succinyl-5-enolpyruvyl-6-hydroxy-3-cyclohexene-1-carboxylic-acid synthase [Acidimicrobiia bacterium]
MAETYEVTMAFADELAAHGMQHVCISPGSRSTPLALAFARHPDIQHSIHHDERSSAFFALGIAKTTRLPVAIITTSGTAAAELHPAIVEARFGRVPLLALTADRPPDLRGTGANQTIDQINLFGTSAKWFQDAPLAAITDAPHARAMAARAWAEALTAPCGPVHINFPFEEPLIPGEMPADIAAMGPARTWAAPGHIPDEAAIRSLSDLVATKRGILLAGPQSDPTAVGSIIDLARATGLPILADPLSGLRTGSHDSDHVVAHYDALAQAGFLDECSPEAAIRFGALPISKTLNSWLAAHPEVAYAVVDDTGWPDPGGTARTVLQASPAAVAGNLAKLVTEPTDEAWLGAWRRADDTAAQALRAPFDEFSELDAIATLLETVPDPATIWVASSMPVRQVDLLLGRSGRRLRLFANRGASGIDGFLSAGIGSAAVDDGPTFLVAGDLSALYDLTALGWAGRHQVDITIVVINNDGGGIFHLLAQAPLPEFEELFGTPHGLDFAAAASLFGLRYTRAHDRADLAAALSQPPTGPQLVEVQFERSASAAAYRSAVDRVVRALAAR